MTKYWLIVGSTITKELEPQAGDVTAVRMNTGNEENDTSLISEKLIRTLQGNADWTDQEVLAMFELTDARVE